MGDLQPGVGYNIMQSPMGDALEILFPAQPEQIVQQFQTEIVSPGATATIRVANGTAFIGGKGQSISGDSMKEWAIKTFSVFPTGKRTTGSDIKSKWVSQGGTVEISNGTVEGGSNTWYVFLVANNYDTDAADSAYPMLAVIAEGSDAYAKSRPFSVDDDTRLLGTLIRVTTVTLYDSTGSPEGAFFAYESGGTFLQNYNCQRMTLAKIVWTDDRWVVTQYAYGPVTFTDDLRTGAVVTLADGAPVPDTSYATEQANWVGSWSGYTKDYGHDTLVPL